MSKNPITIEVLETLDAIERRGSFAKAAEELNKATSAVSYAIQKLEEQLGIGLFQRQGRRSVLTPAGRLIMVEGRHILHTTATLANKAKEVATGWEPRISIAIESIQSYSIFFTLINEFLNAHPSIEIDLCECVLNGGWDALEQGRVDVVIGAPGPVPQQKGYRAIALEHYNLIPVIAAGHPCARLADDSEAIAAALPTLRRVITHDTATEALTRSEGLSREGQKFYVQNIDQKVEAIVAGIGIGHLPRQRIQQHLDSGSLVKLNMATRGNTESFLAWKISNKGKGLHALTQRLSNARWVQ